MADMQLEHADAARAALHSVLSDPAGGMEAISSPEVAANLMRDLLPDAPREANLLATAISVGIPALLRGHVAEGMDTDTAIRLAAASFEARTAFTHDVARWVAVEFAIALGLAGPGERPGIGPQAGPAGPGQVSAPAGAAVTEHLTEGIDDTGEGGQPAAAPLPASIRNWRRLALASGAAALFLAVLAGFGFGYAYHRQLPVPAPRSQGSAPAPRKPAQECTRDALRKAIGAANPQLNTSGWHIESFACLGRWAAVTVDAVSVGGGEGFLERTPSGWTPGPLSGGVYNCSDLQSSFGSPVPAQALAYSLFKDVGRCPPP